MSDYDLTAQRIGKYELLTRLATGGMAEVFLARERGLGGLERLVVIKRILPHLAERHSFVEMFLREGRIIARLKAQSYASRATTFFLTDLSDRIDAAVQQVLRSGLRTGDIAQAGEKVIGTVEMGDAVVAALRK